MCKYTNNDQTVQYKSIIQVEITTIHIKRYMHCVLHESCLETQFVLCAISLWKMTFIQ